MLMSWFTAVLASLSLILSTPAGSSGDVPGTNLQATRPPYRYLVAWAPEDLPPDVESALDTIKGVSATTIRGGVDWMTASHSSTGATLDHPASGYAIPLDLAVIEPKEYAHFVAGNDAQAIRSLTPGHMLLSATEASLRHGGVGLRLSMGRDVHVSGVISDHSAQGYEGLIPAPVPSTWPNANRFVIIKADKPVPKARIHQAIESELTAGQHLVLRSRNEPGFLRFADAVQPQLIIKKTFGEFSARRLDSGRLQIEPHWLDENIRTETVPILGSVTCHRKLFPQLRGALKEVQAKGLSSLIDPTQFAGCFNSRYVAALPGTRLSHHSWGVALDINSHDNPFGAEPNQDPRLVRIMSRWGLTWGGGWAVPDGMHFEWMRFHS